MLANTDVSWKPVDGGPRVEVFCMRVVQFAARTTAKGELDLVAFIHQDRRTVGEPEYVALSWWTMTVNEVKSMNAHGAWLSITQKRGEKAFRPQVGISSRLRRLAKFDRAV